MTAKEKDIIKVSLEEGFTIKVIAERLNKSIETTKNLIGEYKKLTNTYNKDHIIEKHNLNLDFYYEVKPKDILDLFAGISRFWYTQCSEESTVIDNDTDTKISSMLHIDAAELLKAYSLSGKTFDLVDIDPYGCPAELIRDSIKVSSKGLIITFGEKKSERFPNKFKKEYAPKYGIELPEDRKLTFTDILNKIISIGIEEGKYLELYAYCSWKTCNRAYFIIHQNKKEEK